jgi:NDP-sugar pyrophosphorylase family protein
MTRAVIQAGGRGTRLYPYTTVLPKPLMPIGECPILEIVVRQLVHHGFRDITITVGHLGHLIMAVLGDGSCLGARIEYAREDKPRGTMGALSQFRDTDEPLLVMNGDLLTDFDFRAFMCQHLENDAYLSVGVYYKEIPVSLGVLEIDDACRAVGFREKPVLSFPCSMGIYAVSPELIALIPSKGVFGFDDLMALCFDRDITVRAHPFHGLWLDIGRPEDYASAGQLFQEHHLRLCPPIARGTASARPGAKRSLDVAYDGRGEPVAPALAGGR